MSWPSIGGRNVITIQNWQRNKQGEALAILQRAGRDGVALQKIAKKARPTSLVTVVDLDSGSDVASELTAYVAKRGTLVTIVDDLGNTTNYVAVLDVRQLQHRTLATPSGGVTDGTHLLVCQWDVIETAV